MQVLAREWVLAHQHRFDKSDQRARIGLPRVDGRPEESVAFDAVVRCDAQETEVAAAGDILRARRISGRRNIVPGKQGQLDVIDLHLVLARCAIVI